jgi:hypothetical protein
VVFAEHRAPEGARSPDEQQAWSVVGEPVEPGVTPG